MRPGMELVVSPHKSIAELGVIGRAEDMHTILDAERDATMGYLDSVVQDAGRQARACTAAYADRRPHLGRVPPCDDKSR